MKTPALLLLSTCALSAADPSLPTFSEKLPVGPNLSLSGGIESATLPVMDRASRAAASSFLNRSSQETRLQSRMPILDPGERIDRTMPIVRPRTDVDFSLTIRDPAVDSVAVAPLKVPSAPVRQTVPSPSAPVPARP